MHATPFENVVDALDQAGSRVVRRGHGQIMAQCPSHDDKNPSLSVKEADDDSALVHCFAGCDIDDVLSAIGLRKRDLFSGDADGGERPFTPSSQKFTPSDGNAENAEAFTKSSPSGDELFGESLNSSPDSTPTPKTLEARYEYRDETGILAYNKLRFSDKTFSFTRSDGAPGLKGAPRVLYGLPLVLAAIAAGITVYVVEGEKDADALLRDGCVATCNDSGASKPGDSKWLPDYTEMLRGAVVVVVADKDEPGRVHAANVATRLDGVARSVRVVEALEGKDSFDHLAAGHAVGDFVEIEFKAEDADKGVFPGLVAFSDIEHEPLTWLWPGYIPEGKFVLFDGDPSVGKSTLAIDIAARVSTGKPWPDGSPGGEPSGVMVLAAEDGPADTIRPRLDAAGADTRQVFLLRTVQRIVKGKAVECSPTIEDDVAAIEAMVIQKGIKLIVIDVLMAFLGSGTNSHNDQEIRQTLSPLGAMCDRTGCTVIAIRHLNKSSGTNSLYRGGGSIGISGFARAAYIIGRDPDDTERRVFAKSKSNLGVEPESIAYRLVNDPELNVARVEWELGTCSLKSEDLLVEAVRGDPDEESETETWLREYLKASTGWEAGPSDILKAAKIQLGASVSTLRRARIKIGAVVHKTSVKGDIRGPWVWKLPPESGVKKAGNGDGNGDGNPEDAKTTENAETHVNAEAFTKSSPSEGELFVNASQDSSPPRGGEDRSEDRSEGACTTCSGTFDKHSPRSQSDPKLCTDCAGEVA